MQLRYRLRQLWSALWARLDADDALFVARVLNQGQQELFAAMSRFDQRHALDVAYLLQKQGYTDNTLLQAALLHDCGKVNDAGRPIPLLYYGVFVMLQALAPALYWAAVRNGRGPLGHFRVHAEHAARGARRAIAAGSAPEVAALIATYHQAKPGTAGAVLRQADDLC